MAYKKKKILLVDDEEEIREIIAHHLRDQYEVILASNGREAFQLTKEAKPDLVITDLIMPEASGFDFIGSVAGLETPIIAMSGRGGEYLEMAKDLGVARVIEKPFSMEELAELMNDLLSSGG